MSVRKKAFKGASWLALFKFFKQMFSWTITILVARILVPGDYGLMEMATVITGYAAMFSELGLGAAIIQKPHLSQNELSSIFWFAFGTSILLGLSCFGLAYPTALIFNEPKVIPIAQLASVNFILNGLQIVPLNLLKKEIEFKKLGMIELISTIVSCSSMYFMAIMGTGVWTLIGGRIIYCLTALIIVYYIVRWFPKLHFDFNEAKSLIRFGLVVAFGRSFFYIYEKSDRFFAGRVWSATQLGYYSFALQLSQIPTEKIVSLINQVSFSAFSKLQHDTKEFIRFYLDINKMTLSLVLPVFVGGYLVGGDLIRLLLDDKWLPIITVFKYLCLVQIVTSLTAVNNFVHTALGRPQWSLGFNVICAILMSVSFFLAVPYGLSAILIPWFTVYFIICTFWIIISLKKIGISKVQYLKNISLPVISTLVMVAAVLLLKSYSCIFPQFINESLLIMLCFKIFAGAGFYFLFLWFFDRSLFENIKKLRR